MVKGELGKAAAVARVQRYRTNKQAPEEKDQKEARITRLEKLATAQAALRRRQKQNGANATISHMPPMIFSTPPYPMMHTTPYPNQPIPFQNAPIDPTQHALIPAQCIDSSNVQQAKRRQNCIFPQITTSFPTPPSCCYHTIILARSSKTPLLVSVDRLPYQYASQSVHAMPQRTVMHLLYLL